MIEKIEEKIKREGNFIFIDRIGYLRIRDISEIIIHDEGSVSIEMRDNVHHIIPGKGIMWRDDNDRLKTAHQIAGRIVFLTKEQE
jgi:hypothetical protein|nr:MAG TPA: hypothetical protein [Caudoviricetes sp.]